MKRLLKGTGIALLCVSVIVLAVIFLYEPDRCCLCDGQAYTMPCAVDLTTGTVYEAPYCSEKEGCGTFLEMHMPGGGLTDLFQFCRDCRAKLPVFSRYGAVLVDLCDPGQVQFYPVIDGAVYIMRNYRIRIEEDQDRTFSLTVTGMLKN